MIRTPPPPPRKKKKKYRQFGPILPCSLQPSRRQQAGCKLHAGLQKGVKVYKGSEMER